MRYTFILITCLLINIVHASTSDIRLGFDKNTFSEWKPKIFKGETQYTLIKEEGMPVLQANSQKAASALILNNEIDLLKTPFLNWSWRVSGVLQGLNEKEKSGDDYAARVYVILPAALFELYPRSISYVWSGQHAPGESWPNAYAKKKVVMLALQNGDQNKNQWQTEKRNVLDDIKKYFGEEVTSILGIAVMTDTDNSGKQAMAYYKDLFFSEE